MAGPGGLTSTRVADRGLSQGGTECCGGVWSGIMECQNTSATLINDSYTRGLAPHKWTADTQPQCLLCTDVIKRRKIQQVLQARNIPLSQEKPSQMSNRSKIMISGN